MFSVIGLSPEKTRDTYQDPLSEWFRQDSQETDYQFSHRQWLDWSHVKESSNVINNITATHKVLNHSVSQYLVNRHRDKTIRSKVNTPSTHYHTLAHIEFVVIG